jgi:hypothetical protein
MDTNVLIERLARDLAPVRPLWRPAKRAAAWMLGAAAYVAALTVLLASQGPGVELADPRVWLPHLAALVTSSLASWAAFSSVVPGRSKRAVAWVALGALVWIATLSVASRWHSGVAAIAAAHHEWGCVGVILLGGAPLIAVLAVLLRRGAALAPGTTAACAALAVGALANVAACFWRPHAVDDVTLVWHGGALLGLLLVCALGGRFVLRGLGERAAAMRG